MSLAIAVQAVATLVVGALVLVVYGPHEPLTVPSLRPMREPGWLLAEARQRRPKIGRVAAESASGDAAGAPPRLCSSAAPAGPLGDVAPFAEPPPPGEDALARVRAAARWEVF